MWAARRRTIILSTILAAFALLVVLPYWFLHRVAPSCDDGKRNQDELGIDCGGACALICPGRAKDITILWSKVFPVRIGVYDVVAYIENPNFDMSAPSLPYVVKLFDASGSIIAEESGVTYALPSERFVIFRGHVLTGDKVAVRGGVEISNDYRWYTAVKKKSHFFFD